MNSSVVMVIHDAVYAEAPDKEAEMARLILKTGMDGEVEMPGSRVN